MIYDLRSVKDADVKNKTVFLRADLDIPLKDFKVIDDTRLSAWFPTLEYLLSQEAKVIIAGHLGRPEGKDDKLSLKPVAEWASKRFKIYDPPAIASKALRAGLRFKNFGGFEGWEISENIALLENLRFYKEEEENDKEFSKNLAGLAEIYVNDAFASSHRVHASIVGVTKYLPSFAGLRLEKEIGQLSKILNDPKRPLVVIIGGAKIETKLPLVEKMHHFADYVLVGGEIAENDKLLLRVQHEKITGRKSSLLIADLTENEKDITVKSAENFLQIAQNCQTIVWNGPMGLIEDEKYQNGTNILAEGLAETSCYKVVGGGDTLGFLKKKNLFDKFSFASIGGGAMLEFLAGVKLPGLEALRK
ncbi:MAG: phosphoglycerate kinase [Patescibacteria group bacterium]|nr:phosphoglycerate kinase [Patescibacteria group bacterium]